MLYVIFSFFFSPISLLRLSSRFPRLPPIFISQPRTRTHAHLRFQQVPEFFPFISKLSPGIVVAKRVQKIKSCQFLLNNFQENGGWRKEEGNNIKGKKRKEEKKGKRGGNEHSQVA